MENYNVTFDSRDGIYVARHKRYVWLTGHGKFPEDAVNMAEENLKSIRCPNCGWVDGMNPDTIHNKPKASR